MFPNPPAHLAAPLNKTPVEASDRQNAGPTIWQPLEATEKEAIDDQIW
jgi:hypothetical protein